MLESTKINEDRAPLAGKQNGLPVMSKDGLNDVVDGTTMYLQQIGEIKLLDRQGERELGQKVEEGLLVKRIETSLIETQGRAQAGDVAVQLNSYLQSPYWDSLQKVLQDRKYPHFDEVINAGFYQEVVDQVTQQGEFSPTETEEALRNISIAQHLLEREPAAGWDDAGWENYLTRIKEEGKMAGDQFTEANLRLVVSRVKYHRGKGLDLDELIQEGNMGLMTAVAGYDYRKGFKFSTYASWWIRQAAVRAIFNQGQLIRVPAHMAEKAKKMWPVMEKLFQRYGRESTAEEIAQEMDLPEKDMSLLIRAYNKIASLEFPIGKDGGGSLEDLIADPNAVNPQEAYDDTALKQDLDEEMMKRLLDRERKVMRLRFGLEDGRNRTLEEVGREFGVTRERIRQIEAKALRKLRNLRTTRKLKDYLE